MLKPEYHAQFKDVLIHSIRSDDVMADLSVASKLHADWQFLTHLRDRGREAMAAWLDEHFDTVGEHDTVDLHEEFLTTVTRFFEEGIEHPSPARMQLG